MNLSLSSEEAHKILTQTKSNGVRPLMSLASRGYSDEIKKGLDCLENENDLSARIMDQSNILQTPLMFAAANGHVACINVLFDYLPEKDWANYITAVNIFGWPALMCAAFNGHTESVIALLDHMLECLSDEKIVNQLTQQIQVNNSATKSVIQVIFEKNLIDPIRQWAKEKEETAKKKKIEKRLSAIKDIINDEQWSIPNPAYQQPPILNYNPPFQGGVGQYQQPTY